MGYGDAEAPEADEFEFRILDLNGNPAPELETEVTDDDERRLLTEYLNQLVYH